MTDTRTIGTRVGAHARVTVTLEIPASSNWGSDCDIDQIERQAVEDVLGAMHAGKSEIWQKAKVIGNPEVVAVLVRRER